MEGKKVSIIVISYNQGIYIDECLNSILGQTYTDWELIVADDASPDESQAVYEKWLTEHNIAATRIFNQENQGLCKTLNKCLAAVSGAYIKMIAADDWLARDYLASMVAAFEGETDDLGILFSNARFFDESGLQDRTFFTTAPDIGSGWIHERLIQGNFIPALTVFMKASVFRTIGLFDETIWIEDWEYWLRASLTYRFKYVDEVLAFYRMHNTNVSKNRDKLMKGELQILLKFGQDARYKKTVNNFFRDRFYLVSDQRYVLELFESYPFKSRLLHLFFKFRLPRKLYRALQLLSGDRI